MPDRDRILYVCPCFIGLWIALVVLLPSSYAQAQVKAKLEGEKPNDVGFVLNVHGDWFLNRTEIHLGQALPAGGKVQTQSPDERRNSITIALLNGTTITRSCDMPGSCTQPISLPEALKSRSSLAERIVEAVQGLFGQQPERYISAMSRGGKGPLQEAVVKLENGQVDLGPVLKGLKKDVYQVRFQPINDDEPSREPLTSVAFKWEPNNPAPVSVSGLRPGLYKMRLANDPTGTEAWVLVSGSVEYKKLSTSFQELSDVPLSDSIERR